MRSAAHTRMRRAGCKILAAALLLAAPLPARAAADGPIYDVFAKALAPFASSVFGGGDGQPGAMVAECLVSGGTGPLADAAKGTRFRIALQAPDRLRVDVARGDGKLTACRNGRELWAVPGEPMRALAKAAGFDLDKTAPDKDSPPLIPIALDPQMLAFLPVVFDVKDLGTEGDPARRVLQFALLDQLRQAIKAEEFSGRAWIGDDYKPTRLVISTKDGSLDIAVEKLGFADQLVPAAWQPDDGAQALRLPASALNDLFGKMLGTKASEN